MAIRLTDAEIQKFAKASSSEILEAMLLDRKRKDTDPSQHPLASDFPRIFYAVRRGDPEGRAVFGDGSARAMDPPFFELKRKSFIRKGGVPIFYCDHLFENLFSGVVGSHLFSTLCRDALTEEGS